MSARRSIAPCFDRRVFLCFAEIRLRRIALDKADEAVDLRDELEMARNEIDSLLAERIVGVGALRRASSLAWPSCG
jgi:hypothetical protein